MKKQYIFILLISIMVYLIYLVIDYKYREYKVFYYTENLISLNEGYISSITQAREILEYKNTRAYKNKILKSQQGLKNPGEIVINLITEEKYKKYTQTGSLETRVEEMIVDLNNEESLIATMNIYQKWLYLLFNKDTR